jgi:hypothetical protein
MGKVKNWMMEQEELVRNAVDKGITDFDDVMNYVNVYVIADPRYVAQVLNEEMGLDRLTEPALDDVSQGHNSDIIDGYNKDDIGESPDY